MTNREILQIALEQSALDCNCRPEDFLSGENRVVLSRADPRARAYLALPFALDMVCYGAGIVAQASPQLQATAAWYIGKYPAVHCFETPHIIALNEKLAAFGCKVCYMAEYFLPDTEALRPLGCRYPLRVLRPAEFAGCYTDTWANALCRQRAELDVLAVGAFDGARLVGLAGCSADCSSMYQIGVDVLPAYRRQGIAAALTSRLAAEVFAMGKVPFYCAAWSNIPSVRNAIRCGFRPAWAQLTARDSRLVDKLNR